MVTLQLITCSYRSDAKTDKLQVPVRKICISLRPIIFRYCGSFTKCKKRWFEDDCHVSRFVNCAIHRLYTKSNSACKISLNIFWKWTTCTADWSRPTPDLSRAMFVFVSDNCCIFNKHLNLGRAFQ